MLPANTVAATCFLIYMLKRWKVIGLRSSTPLTIRSGLLVSISTSTSSAYLACCSLVTAIEDFSALSLWPLTPPPSAKYLLLIVSFLYELELLDLCLPNLEGTHHHHTQLVYELEYVPSSLVVWELDLCVWSSSGFAYNTVSASLGTGLVLSATLSCDAGTLSCNTIPLSCEAGTLSSLSDPYSESLSGISGFLWMNLLRWFEG